MAQSTVDCLQSSLQTFEDLAKGSRPRDVFDAQQWEMAGAHAFLINALLHIYERAPTIETDKEKDFVAYALQCCVLKLLQEISYIAPDKLRASALTEAELKHISEVSDKHMQSMPPTTFLVYTVTHTPKSSGFPPAPSFVKNILVPYVFYFPNRRLWQFAPKS